ncbi:hypothetical protein SRABI106_04420 [Rahnella aquatilis]|nr:hypothetical protein SRABI106_04420 [Rahnella aquatilis]
MPQAFRHIQMAQQCAGAGFALRFIHTQFQQRLHHQIQCADTWDHPQKLADPADRMAANGQDLARFGADHINLLTLMFDPNFAAVRQIVAV